MALVGGIGLALAVDRRGEVVAPWFAEGLLGVAEAEAGDLDGNGRLMSQAA